MRLSTDLDAIDLHILDILQSNGRTPMGQLAELVGLSAPAVTERIRKLEDRGVIIAFLAQLSPPPLGLDIAAFIMVRVDTSRHYQGFTSRAAEHPEVLECHAITGDASHLLKIRTRNTMTLEALLAEIQKWPGVIGTRTSLVLSTHKESPRLHTGHLAGIIAQERSRRERKVTVRGARRDAKRQR